MRNAFMEPGKMRKKIACALPADHSTSGGAADPQQFFELLLMMTCVGDLRPRYCWAMQSPLSQAFEFN